MVIAKARKLSARPKIFLFSKRVKDYGNSLADICLVMQIVGQAGGSISMQQLQIIWIIQLDDLL